MRLGGRAAPRAARAAGDRGQSEMTPVSAAPAPRPTSSTRGRWRACCEKGELDAVWMPDRCPILPRRLARREQLMRGRTRRKNEIQAVLQRRLQDKPPFADLFGVKGRQWLAGLALPVEERESVDAGLRHVAFMDSEIAAVDRLIAQQALAWPEIPADDGLSRSGPEGPPIRRDTSTLRSDPQARVGVRAMSTGQSSLERGQAARPAARVL